MTNEEPKKLYLLPNGLISYCRTSDEDIEYTHTDALIGKACEWIRKNTYESTCEQIVSKKSYPFMSDFIEEFQQAMKGGQL